MGTPIIDEAAKVFADPTSYADEPRLHAALTHLRAHAPVSLVDIRPYRPFWAITRHADIMKIERANDLFINAPRPLLATADGDDMAREQLDAGMGLRTLIHMDDPQHRVVRAIGALERGIGEAERDDFLITARGERTQHCPRVDFAGGGLFRRRFAG